MYPDINRYLLLAYLTLPQNKLSNSNLCIILTYSIAKKLDFLIFHVSLFAASVSGTRKYYS